MPLKYHWFGHIRRGVSLKSFSSTKSQKIVIITESSDNGLQLVTVVPYEWRGRISAYHWMSNQGSLLEESLCSICENSYNMVSPWTLISLLICVHLSEAKQTYFPESVKLILLIWWLKLDPMRFTSISVQYQLDISTPLEKTIWRIDKFC